jgi:hypothetical protein
VVLTGDVNTLDPGGCNDSRIGSVPGSQTDLVHVHLAVIQN